MILLLLPLCLLLFLSFKYREFRSPYKLVMIFGKKGSGKSSYLVSLALHYHKRGWLVYSNLSGVNLPWLRIIDPADLGKFSPPSNSVLLLDEAGTLYDNRNFKSFRPETRDWFKLQRHYKCIVYLASQSFDIDKKLRDLTDSMILCQSFLPWLSLRRPIRRKITLTEASSMGESRIADELKFCWFFSWRFCFLPKFSKYFDSFIAPELPEISFTSLEN